MTRMRHTRRGRAREARVLDKLRSMLAEAESDPARFRAECAAAAGKLGVRVEHLYALLERDPEAKKALKQALANAAISGAAKFARRALGL